MRIAIGKARGGNLALWELTNTSRKIDPQITIMGRR